ncbi:MAG: hypothetical protein JW967_02740 [Dehalococcoidales bacterium]|nr:hypothetical protein [Dehalococcoidales bacterium]
MLNIRSFSDQKIIGAKEQALLSRKINELPLSINGTRLEQLIVQLYKELELAGISFKPKTYLSDSWGCPDRVPVIGIPFYLVDPILYDIDHKLTGDDFDTDFTLMMLLRHEAGHAINYAYRLYENSAWQTLFGQFSLPYNKDYPVVPFSNRFVNHLPKWYGQKHPDDDFAETFAVWLTPGSHWQKQYTNTPALDKLLYVDEVVARYGRNSPSVTDGKLDIPTNEMIMTVGEYYEKYLQNYIAF